MSGRRPATVGERGAPAAVGERRAPAANRLANGVACIGFMGAGKSTAARSIAAALGLEAVDVDDAVQHALGKSIADVFADDGEAAFRQAEERITLELLGDHRGRVVSLGGGAVLSPAVREALNDRLVMWLDVDAQTAWRRCRDSGRPLARDRDSFARRHREREPIYAALADLIAISERPVDAAGAIDAARELPAGARLLWATTASASYPAYVASGLLAQRFWPASVAGRRFLVSDGQVASRHAGALAPVAGQVLIMPGEQSKTVAHAEIVWTELARAGMLRQDVVVALGGGVVGDLAGFCAATYQRGVRWVGVPTSLVAQVDSAYGGKTGVDLPEAKNYVGAYHHPAAVIVDPNALATLPRAELAAGFAEVVKTALVAGGGLWDRIRAGADPTAPDAILHCARTKLRIVAQDERDAGARQQLNLGHTVGHAIETATGYARYRHGEAVGLGLLAALTMSGQDALREEVRELLMAWGLPTTLDGVDPGSVIAATAADKKRSRGGPVPFVLLDGPGAARPGCRVAPSELTAAVAQLAG